MRLGSHITVVVPAYDEAPRIAAMLHTIPAYVDTIIVVDDGSEDRTAEAARACPDPRIEVIEHTHNQGVGAALRTGYRRAFERGTDVAVVMAGDGQMDSEDLPTLLDAVNEGAGYAKGTRLVAAADRSQMPASRLVGNRVLATLTRLVTGLPITDSQCGYTALHRSAAGRLPLQRLWPRYGYPNDLLAMCVEADVPVVEVPVRAVYADEVSGVRVRDAAFTVPFVILRAWARSRSAPTVTSPLGELRAP